MSDRYKGLAKEDRGGCFSSAVVGLVVLFFDFGRVIGDPAPGTEDLWWRRIPFLLPTLVAVVLTFIAVRYVLRSKRHDDGE